jgi:hypothetical protein
MSMPALEDLELKNSFSVTIVLRTKHLERMPRRASTDH